MNSSDPTGLTVLWSYSEGSLSWCQDGAGEAASMTVCQNVSFGSVTLPNDPPGASDKTVQKIAGRLASAYSLAEILLKSNQDCANLFGHGTTANGTTLSAAQVLDSLFGGGPYGEITIGDIPSAKGTTVSATEQPETIQSGSSIQNAALITLNDLAGSYVTGTFESQVVTLLHELGHAMNDIFGAGTSLIQPDGPSVKNGTQISMDNTALVDNGCFRNVTLPGGIILP